MATIETRERILDAAERLFASQGFAATSLRTVITEADVNLAAIHYHFGSKDALIRAVFARRLGPLNAERLRLLDELEAAPGRGLAVEDILRAFIRPALMLACDGDPGAPLLMLLLGRLHSEPGHDLRALVYDQFVDVSRRFIDALGRSLPELPLDELYTRFHFVVGTMASCFADPQRLEHLSSGRVDARDTDALIARMIRFLAAGLRAPGVPSTASARADATSAEATGRDGGRRGAGLRTARTRAAATRGRIA
jgi:AcrR family transcriptional regulator